MDSIGGDQTIAQQNGDGRTSFSAATQYGGVKSSTGDPGACETPRSSETKYFIPDSVLRNSSGGIYGYFGESRFRAIPRDVRATRQQAQRKTSDHQNNKNAMGGGKQGSAFAESGREGSAAQAEDVTVSKAKEGDKEPVATAWYSSNYHEYREKN